MWSAVERSHYGSYWEESDLCGSSGSSLSRPHLPSCLPRASFLGPLGVLPGELSSWAHVLLSAPPVSLLWKWGSSPLAPVSPLPWPHTAYFMDRWICMAVLELGPVLLGLKLLVHSSGRNPSEA